MAALTPAGHPRSAAAPPPAGTGMQGKTGEGAASALAHLLQSAAGTSLPAAAPPVFADNAAMTDHELTEAVRRACIEAALEAYESAGISGLCAEGRWEAAISAMQSLDLREIARRDHSPDGAPRR